MRRNRRTASLLVAGSALVLAALGGASATRAAATYTGFVVSNEIGRNGAATIATDLDPSDLTATISAENNAPQGIVVHDGTWIFSFGSGSEPFAVGRYATASGIGGSDNPTLTVSGLNTSPCSFGSIGSFTIVELPTWTGTHVSTFAADLEFRCVPAVNVPNPTWLHASVRVNAATPPAVVTVPRTTGLADATVGQSSVATITVAGLGSGAVPIPSLAVDGADAAMFAIEADTCSGTALADRDSCTFAVRFAPTGTGPRVADVIVNADQPTYAHRIHLSAIGRSPLLLVPSSLALNSDPGDWVGGGRIVSYGSDQITDPNGYDDQAAVAFSDGAMRFTDIDGAVPGVGHFDVPFSPPNGIPSLSVSAFGHGCNAYTGSFDVVDAPVFDTDGTILRLGVDFVQFCEGSTARLRGSLRFHSTVAALDILPPEGSVGLAGGGSVATTEQVSLDVSASDPHGVDQVALSNDGAAWTTLPYAAVVPWTLTPGDGVKTVRAKWRDGLGTWSLPASAQITVNTTVPVSTAPSWFIATGHSLENGRARIRLQWSGTGVDHFEVAQSVDGGPFMTFLTQTAPWNTELLVNPGHTYQFRVRGFDGVGTAGAWATGPVSRFSAVSERSSLVRYGGRWSNATSTSSFWGGTAKYSTTAGSTASYTFTGRSITWVGVSSPTRGAARVYIDGKLKATVNLWLPTTHTKSLIWQQTWSAAARHTITIKVVGTSGRPRIDVDGFIVGS